MHEAIISYSTNDKKWADAACSVLEGRGIRCWIAPRDIVPGTEWGAAIIAGIDACKVMVLIFSSSANESPQVRREVERAISKGLTIIPCRIENVMPAGAMEYALGNTHWLDVFTPPVEKQMKRLAESVEALLSRNRRDSELADAPPAAAAASTGRTEKPRETNVATADLRGKHRLIAAAVIALSLLLAVGLSIVFWVRKNDGSPAGTAVLDKPVSTPQTPPPSVASRSTVESQPSDGFVPLFNGKDLSGWTSLGQICNWRVQDGVLVGFGSDASHLYSTRDDFRDFHVRVEARISDGGNSGIFFRAASPGGAVPQLYEAQINSTNRQDTTRSGSLFVDGKCVVNFPTAAPPEQWFTEEIIAQGKHIIIKVDGRETANFIDGRHQMGHLALQHRREPTVVEFRKIEIKELTPNGAAQSESKSLERSIPASTAGEKSPTRTTTMAAPPVARPTVLEAKPKAAAPAKISTRPFLIRGDWTIKNDELIQPTLASGINVFPGETDEYPLLVLGEPTLSNYDLTLEVEKTGGRGAMGVRFHWLGPRHFRQFKLVENTGMAFAFCDRGKYGREPRNWKDLKYSSNRWYSLKVEVRGSTFRGYLDGALQFTQTDARFAHGRISLFTDLTAARFRHIKVSDPEGNVLFEGLPELPAAVTNRSSMVSGDNPSSLSAGEMDAASSQKQCADRLKMPAIWTNSLGMKFALIPPGEFQMGSLESEQGRGNEQQHRVRITKPFYLGVYELTQGEFERVIRRNPSRFSNGPTEAASGPDTNRNPIESVTWYDAIEFLNTLSKKEGRRAYYHLAVVERDSDRSIKKAIVTAEIGDGYRLPTEAQWEYACRGGSTTAFNFGAINNGADCNCRGTLPYLTKEQGPALGRPVPVGSYRPNALGLYDMHGNVWEFCWDIYGQRYYENSPEADPQGPADGRNRVMRGAAWLDPGFNCRSANRHLVEPNYRFGNTGFRVACDVAPASNARDAKTGLETSSSSTESKSKN